MCKNFNFCRSDSLTTQGIYCLDTQNCCYYKESSMKNPLPVLQHMHSQRAVLTCMQNFYWHIGSKWTSQMHMKLYISVFFEVGFVQRVDPTSTQPTITTREQKTASCFAPLKPTIRFNFYHKSTFQQPFKQTHSGFTTLLNPTRGWIISNNILQNVPKSSMRNVDSNNVHNIFVKQLITLLMVVVHTRQVHNQNTNKTAHSLHAWPHPTMPKTSFYHPFNC
jgi:hypothetical protein